jgi:hypothetical protein
MLCVSSRARMSSRWWVWWVWVWTLIEGRCDGVSRPTTAMWMRSALLALLNPISCSAIVCLCSMRYYEYKCSGGIALAPARMRRSMQADRQVLWRV